MKKILIQAFICLIISLAVYLLKPAQLLFSAGIWLIIPLSGAVSSYLITRRGINPYCAWIAPPVVQTIGAVIASAGYLPGFGFILLTIFLSVTGAAFADTYNKLKPGRRK